MIHQQILSTLKIDSIFNIFLQIMSKLFAEAVAKLIQICWELFYYSTCFYKVRTVIFCKQKKNDYISFRFWRLIILLNTVDKMIETVTVSQLQCSNCFNYFIYYIKQHNKFTNSETDVVIFFLLVKSNCSCFMKTY